jgi:glycogen synthase
MSESRIKQVLMLHGEAIYFGGSEVLLARLATLGLGPAMRLTVARVVGSPLARALPAEVPALDLPANQPFSVGGLRRQLAVLRRAEFDVLHAWGARAWEVAALAGLLTGRPVVGTLHDHPAAGYLTPARRRLMRWTARFGLDRVTVVSEALRAACISAGWPEHKLAVVHNGLVARPAQARAAATGPLRFGFLGSLTAAKGLPDLLASAAELARHTPSGWELHIAGRAQTEAEAAQLRKWQEPFAGRAWWPQVRWCGWVEPADFLAGVDVLVFPSRAFETFGLAPAEAALAGVPTVAARTGAVPEVVADGETGWLFPPGDVMACAAILIRLLANPGEAATRGAAARERVLRDFPEAKMVAGYRTILSALRRDGC